MTLALIVDQYGGSADEERRLLEPLGITVALRDANPDRFAEQLSQASALMVLDTLVNEALLQRAPLCQVVATYGVGVDNVDLEAARRRGLAVSNVPDYCTNEVADHTISLWLAVERRIAIGDRRVRAGSWMSADLGQLRRLEGLRFGLLGLGRIARAVASRVKAFGAQPIAFDPFVAAGVFGSDDIERASTLEDLAAQVQVLSLHIPLSEETKGIVSESVLNEMAHDAILINTARGPLVDEPALLRALRRHDLAGAGLDVFSEEPPDPSAFAGLDHVVLTPHIAFLSTESRQDAQRGVAAAVAAALNGEAVPNRVV